MEYIDLKAQYQKMKTQIDKMVLACMQNADFIMGSAVEEFEQQLADFLDVKHVIACGNGTDALQLIYMSHGIGNGDAVFCPAMTFIASVEPASLLGATPVFCEIDTDSYNILPESLERQINRVLMEGKLHARAIVAVDFLGNPADYEALREIAERYKLLLIEDAAQSMGSSYRGKRCGSLGDIAATSFFPSKPLGCYGDGGAVLTNDNSIAKVVRSMRIHGKGKTKYDNVRIGLNSRLDTIQAEVLKIKLEYLEEEMQLRQLAALKYDQGLKNIVKIPCITEGAVSSYAQYVIQLRNRYERDDLKNYLERRGIPSIMYYPNPLHLLPVYQNVNAYGESLKNSELYGENNLGLPFSAYIKKEEQEKVIRSVVEFMEEKRK